MTPTHQPESPRAFDHARGFVTYRGNAISDADANWYRELYRDELHAALAAGEDRLWEAARALLHEIVNAQEAQRKHRRDARQSQLRKAA